MHLAKYVHNTFDLDQDLVSLQPFENNSVSGHNSGSLSPNSSSSASSSPRKKLCLNTQMFSPKAITSYHTLVNLLEAQKSLEDREAEQTTRLAERTIEKKTTVPKMKRRKGIPLRSPKSSFDVTDIPGVVFTWGKEAFKIVRQPIDYTNYVSTVAQSMDFQADDSSDGQRTEPCEDIEYIKPKACSHRRATTSKKPPMSSRICASCGVTKTPYWREAWDSSVVLCNACGLRYSKFKKRCVKCFYVPRKDDKGGRFCPLCHGDWA